jgi:hypothetical protein
MLKKLWQNVRFWIGLAFSDPSVIPEYDHSPSEPNAPITIPRR